MQIIAWSILVYISLSSWMNYYTTVSWSKSEFSLLKSTMNLASNIINQTIYIACRGYSFPVQYLILYVFKGLAGNHGLNFLLFHLKCSFLFSVIIFIYIKFHIKNRFILWPRKKQWRLKLNLRKWYIVYQIEPINHQVPFLLFLATPWYCWSYIYCELGPEEKYGPCQLMTWEMKL